jgi:putative endonuclease
VVVVVDRNALGRWGEDIAVAHLEGKGYEVVARNWRCRDGELDVVVRHGTALVFVEVKTRSSQAYGEPAEAVTPKKARRIRGLAGSWLNECRPHGVEELRFDVVSVLRHYGAPPEVAHLQGAF